MKTILACMTLVAATLVGCSSEVNVDNLDSNAFFPQDYESSFAQLGACRKSATHSDPYYKLHITASSQDAFAAGMPVPEGTVLVKTQFQDDACTDFSRWTAMKKQTAGFDPTHGDFEWQNIDGEGQIAEQGKLGNCASCHSGCTNTICSK